MPDAGSGFGLWNPVGGTSGPVERRAQVLMNPRIAAASMASPVSDGGQTAGTGVLSSGVAGFPSGGAPTPGATPGPGITFHSMASPSPVAAHLGLLSDAIGRRLQQLTGGG